MSRPASPVRFHIAHLYEVSNRIKTAKEQYEQLLLEKQLPPLLRADIYRQLGGDNIPLFLLSNGNNDLNWSYERC